VMIQSFGVMLDILLTLKFCDFFPDTVAVLVATAVVEIISHLCLQSSNKVDEFLLLLLDILT
jgi:purine-cytosine permease-like protein